MREKHATLLYALVQTAVWGLYGVLFSYANRYLLAMGLSNTLAGVVLAVSTAIAMAAQPVITAFVDRAFLTVRQVIFAAGGVMVLCVAGLLMTHALWPTVILYCFGCGALQILPSFGNALGMETLQRGIKMHYGLARGMGAVSFGIGAQIAVPFIERYGLGTVPVMSILFALILMVSALLYPAGDGGAREEQKPTDIRTFFARNPSFGVLLLGSVLLYMGHNILNNCMYQIAVFKGNAAAQGTALLIAAVLELPAMLWFTKLVRFARCDSWLKVGSVFFTVKILLILLLPGAAGLCAAQIAQMLGYGVYTMASVYYVASVIPEQDVVKGQTYLGLTNTVGCLAAHFTGGALIDAVGVGAMLLVCGGISALGTLVVSVSARRVEETVGAKKTE